MAFTLSGRTVEKIALFGSGPAAADLALFFSTAFVRNSVSIVMIDQTDARLEEAAARIREKIAEGSKGKPMKPELAEAVLGGIRFSTDPAEASGAVLAVDASEEGPGKRVNAAHLDDTLPEDTIVAIVTDSIDLDDLFNGLKRKERWLALHFCQPLARNMLVEIAPAPETKVATVDFVSQLLELSGKLPIVTRDGHSCFAASSFRHRLAQAARLCVTRGEATEADLDALAAAALGSPLFTPGKGKEAPACADEAAQALTGRLKGACFLLASALVESGTASIEDLDLALEIGFKMKGPFALMNREGIARALELAEEYAAAAEGVEVPAILRNQAASGEPWFIPVVLRRDFDDVALVTIRRPRFLNALDRDVFSQIRSVFESVKQDGAIKAAVLTGFGIKAFVSGADIRELSRLKGPDEGYALSSRGQKIFTGVENLGKPVVAAMNGLAVGGGNDCAMACTVRIAGKGTKVLAGQPEPNLGLIPGYGGTQRLPRLIGMERAWSLLRIGNPISSSEAREWGLVLEEVAREELIDEAMRLARGIASGAISVPAIPKGPIDLPDDLPEIDVGHLSRKADEIIRRTIIEGAGMSLEEGLELEARGFGECFGTKDTRIGLENFLTNGPRSKAEFTHS